MKRISFFLLALVTIAGFTSCKKETMGQPETNVVPVAPNTRLLLASTDSYNTYSFEYNADKTIKTCFVNGAKWEFSYQPNKMTQTFFINNQKRGVVVYELVNGLAKKQTGTYFDTNGTITETNETIFIYNAGGLLIEEQYKKNGAYYGTANMTYDNNNDMISYIAKDQNGAYTSNSEFEYYPDILDKSGSFGQFNSGCTGSILPKKSKHMIKKQTTIISNKHYYFTYTLDADGYVLTRQMKDDSNQVVDNITNTWQ